MRLFLLRLGNVQQGDAELVFSKEGGELQGCLIIVEVNLCVLLLLQNLKRLQNQFQQPKDDLLKTDGQRHAVLGAALGGDVLFGGGNKVQQLQSTVRLAGKLIELCDRLKQR